MGRPRIRAGIIIAVLIAIAFFIGFYLGGIAAIETMAKIASKFVEIDYGLIKTAVFQYENHIGDCLNRTEWKITK